MCRIVPNFIFKFNAYFETAPRLRVRNETSCDLILSFYNYFVTCGCYFLVQET
jgi:hypothetical protein